MKYAKCKTVGLALAAMMVAAMAACSNAPAKDEETPDAAPPAATPATPEETTTPPSDTAEDGGETKETPAADVAELPERKELNVTVEGETTPVSASLTKSELGYAFYLMEGFEFTPEEPGKDMVFHQEFPDFFLRIEPLPEDTDLAEARASAEAALKAVGGDVIDTKETFFDEEIRSKAEFILHASGESGSVNMIVMKIDGKPFRFTLNFPLSEAAEGVSPRFYPMIRSIVVTE